MKYDIVGNLEGAREALRAGSDGTARAHGFLWEKFMTKPLVTSEATPQPVFLCACRCRCLRLQGAVHLHSDFFSGAPRALPYPMPRLRRAAAGGRGRVPPGAAAVRRGARAMLVQGCELRAERAASRRAAGPLAV